MPALPSGISSTQAQQIQRALNEKTGASLKIDGQFGPLSISALQKYQAQIGVPLTGIYDSATQAILGPFMAQKYLGPTSFQQAAQKLGVDVATVRPCVRSKQGAQVFSTTASASSSSSARSSTSSCCRCSPPRNSPSS